MVGKETRTEDDFKDERLEAFFEELDRFDVVALQEIWGQRESLRSPTPSDLPLQRPQPFFAQIALVLPPATTLPIDRISSSR